MKFSFDDDKHEYQNADGVIVPSVTQVLSLAGMRSTENIPLIHLRRKGQIGTAVHEATAFFDDDALDFADLDPLLTGYVESYHRFKHFHDVQLIERPEQRGVLILDGLEYGYTYDRFLSLELAGGRFDAVVDLKTSTKAAAWWRIQLAGYHPAVGRSCLRIALHLQPDGSYHHQKHLFIYRDDNDFDTWRHALHVAWWRLLNE